MRFSLLLALVAALSLGAGFGFVRMAAGHDKLAATNPSSVVSAPEPEPAVAAPVPSEKPRKPDPANPSEVADLLETYEKFGVEGFLAKLHAMNDPTRSLPLIFECAKTFTSAQFEDVLTEHTKGDYEIFGGGSGPVFLLELWVALDPNAAIDYGLAKKGTDLAFLSLALFAARDYEAALERFDEVFQNYPAEPNDPFGLASNVEDRLARKALFIFGLGSRSPDEALRILRAEGQELGELHGMGTLFSRTTRVGESTLDEVLRFEDPDHRNAIASELFATWFRQDPSSAMAGLDRYVDHSPGALSPFGILNYVMDSISELAVADADLAFQIFDMIKPRVEMPEWNDSALEVITKAVAKSDPEHALEILLERSNQDPGPLLEIASRWDAPPSFRLNTLDRLIETTGTAELLFHGTDDPFPGSIFDQLLYADPAATVEWTVRNVEELPHPLGDVPAVGRLFEKQGWIGQRSGEALAALSLEQAIEKAASIPAGDLRDGFILGLVQEGAAADPEATATFMESLDGSEAETASLALAGKWMESDSDAAMQFARDQGDEVLLEVIRSWSDRDVSSALAWMADNNHADFPKYVTDPGVHQQWIDQDAFGGAAVVSALPPAQAQTAMADYVTDWAVVAPEEASVFINDSMEPGPVRDAAIMSLATAITPNDPDSARQWLTEISDPVMREEALKAVE